MNKISLEIIKKLKSGGKLNQRQLSDDCNCSIGMINKCLKELAKESYINLNYDLTQKAENLIKCSAPEKAIILAAGMGMRMIPINRMTPKALLEVNGETLIERIIKQLHEAGIEEIYIVVGFMKEMFEYLIDEYNVKLIVNMNYNQRNNLRSLSLVSDKLCNSYIIPSDIWFKNNPFSNVELYSWYMVTDSDDDCDISINRKGYLHKSQNNDKKMVGCCYLREELANKIKKKLLSFDLNPNYNNCFWEATLFDNDKIEIYAKQIEKEDAYEINTYEQLREIDSNSKHISNDAISIISKSLNVEEREIKNIKTLKKGMTNRSFCFECFGQKYIMRIPGEGTDQLINREQEANVYRLINNFNICDDIVYINENTGYKITKYIENSRTCNPKDINDVKKCLLFLKKFHKLKLKTNHAFDLFEYIEFYESLWEDQKSIYRDYNDTKENVYSLRKYIEDYEDEYFLTHIDAVPDNFLIYKNSSEEEIRLIDWEYSGNQDQHLDIAMFCIYALYNSDEIEKIINIYFENNCPNETKIKIYCYIAICGLLWSNWCEYKSKLGVEFGEYSIKQYRYAKEYYELAYKEMKKIGYEKK